MNQDVSVYDTHISVLLAEEESTVPLTCVELISDIGYGPAMA